MARYIDADALIKRLGINEDCTECSYCTRKCFCSWDPDPGEICIAISEQPTVTINDPVAENKVTNCHHIADDSKKGDPISRADVIRWVKTECNPYGKPTLDFESGKKVIDHLKQMPSVQPERKTGKWINGHWDGVINFRIDGSRNCWFVRECSNCHEEIEGKPTKYCPNCGARMKEGEEHY